MVSESGDMEQPYFEDAKEEATYWKQTAEEYLQK